MSLRYMHIVTAVAAVASASGCSTVPPKSRGEANLVIAQAAHSAASSIRPTTKKGKVNAAQALRAFTTQFNRCDSDAKTVEQNACRLALMSIQDSTLDLQRKSSGFHLFGTNAFDPTKYHERIVFQRYANVPFDGLHWRIGVGFYVAVNNNSNTAGLTGSVQGVSVKGSGKGRQVDIVINDLGISSEKVEELMPVAPEITASFINGIGAAFVRGFNPHGKSPGILQDPSKDLKICPQVLGHFHKRSAQGAPNEERIRWDIGLLTEVLNDLPSCRQVVPNTLMRFYSLSKETDTHLLLPIIFSASGAENSGAIIQEFQRYRFRDGYGIMGAAAIYAISGSGISGSLDLASSLGAAIINLSSSGVKIDSRFLTYGDTHLAAIPAAPSDPSFNYVFTVYRSFQSIKDELRDVRVNDLVEIQNPQGEYVPPTTVAAASN